MTYLIFEEKNNLMQNAMIFQRLGKYLGAWLWIGLAEFMGLCLNGVACRRRSKNWEIKFHDLSPPLRIIWDKFVLVGISHFFDVTSQCCQICTKYFYTFTRFISMKVHSEKYLVNFPDKTQTNGRPGKDNKYGAYLPSPPGKKKGIKWNIHVWKIASEMEVAPPH